MNENFNGNNNNNSMGFTRPFGKDLEVSLARMIGEHKAVIEKNPALMCPHRRKKNALDMNDVRFESALEPVTATRYKEDGSTYQEPVYRKEVQTIFGKKVEVVYDLFRCTECKAEVEIPRLDPTKKIEEYVETMNGLFSIMTKLMKADLFIRTGFSSKNVSSGASLLMQFLTNADDTKRLSYATFQAALQVFKENYNTMTDEVKGKLTAPEVDPSVIVGVIAQENTQQIRYGDVIGNYKSAPQQSVFARDFLGANIQAQPQVLNQVAPVNTAAPTGEIKIKK